MAFSRQVMNIVDGLPQARAVAVRDPPVFVWPHRSEPSPSVRSGSSFQSTRRQPWCMQEALLEFIGRIVRKTILDRAQGERLAQRAASWLAGFPHLGYGAGNECRHALHRQCIGIRRQKVPAGLDELMVGRREHPSSVATVHVVPAGTPGGRQSRSREPAPRRRNGPPRRRPPRPVPELSGLELREGGNLGEARPDA